MYLSRFFAVASVILLTGCATTATESVYVTQEKGKLDSYISAGVAYYDQGDYSAAIQQFKSALSIDSGHPVVLYELSLAYMVSNQNKDCITTAKRGLENTTEFDSKFNGLIAACYSQSGDIKQAISMFETSLRSAPDNFELHYNLGVSYAKVNDNKNAIKHLQQTIKIKPDYASPYLALGELYRRNNHRIPAIYFFMQFGLLEQDTARTEIAAKNIFLLSDNTFSTDKNQISVNLDSAEGTEHFLPLDSGLQTLAIEAAPKRENNPARYHVNVLTDLVDLSRDIQQDNDDLTSTFIWQYAGSNITALRANNEFRDYAYSMVRKAGIYGISERLAAFIN